MASSLATYENSSSRNETLAQFQLSYDKRVLEWVHFVSKADRMSLVSFWSLSIMIEKKNAPVMIASMDFSRLKRIGGRHF